MDFETVCKVFVCFVVRGQGKGLLGKDQGLFELALLLMGQGYSIGRIWGQTLIIIRRIWGQTLIIIIRKNLGTLIF